MVFVFHTYLYRRLLTSLTVPTRPSTPQTQMNRMEKTFYLLFRRGHKMDN